MNSKKRILALSCLISTGATFPAFATFHFYPINLSNFSNISITFQAVSEMNNVATIQYRHSNSPLFSTIRMPGIASYGNVTFHYGKATNSDTWWRFSSNVSLNTIAPADYTVKLTGDDMTSQPVTFTFRNALPTKIIGTRLADDGNTILIDELQLAYETMITTAK